MFGGDHLKVTLKISSRAAGFLSRGVSGEEKLKVVRGEVELSPSDLVTVLFFLAHDTEGEVRDGARRRLAELPEGLLRGALSSPSLHPKVLDGLARLHFSNKEIAELIAFHGHCSEETLAFLAEHGIQVTRNTHHGTTNAPESGDIEKAEEFEEDGDGVVDENSEAFRGKYQLAQMMGVAEKVKMAQTGDKEWRMILIRDPNKLVSGTVIKNPRITEQEILAIAKSSIQNDEILRVICANKEWIKNYQIRKALVENVKTPLPTALRFLATLTEKDLAQLAKSKNISSILSTQARKLLLNKKKNR